MLFSSTRIFASIGITLLKPLLQSIGIRAVSVHFLDEPPNGMPAPSTASACALALSDLAGHADTFDSDEVDYLPPTYMKAHAKFVIDFHKPSISYRNLFWLGLAARTAAF